MAKIKVGKYSLKIPDKFEALESMPEDPKDSVAYGYENEKSSCFALFYADNSADGLPFEDPELLINSIHRILGEDQGLLQVQSGKTASRQRYIYSIVKSRMESSATQYTLTFQIDMGSRAMNIQAFFNETGTPGERENAIFEMLKEKGVMKDDRVGWERDPYNAAVRKGFRMNVSEAPHLDAKFPGHPLSELRKFAAYLAENN